MSTRTSDNLKDSELSANTPEYSVSEISTALKRTVEGAFSHVRVRGEVSGLKRPASGHIYFDLKDEKSVINAVCWKGVAGKLRFLPEDGLEVIVTGKITTYAPRSNYQLVVETIEPAGAGALMALLEERRKKLAVEGLFDAERKQAIPYLPNVIGVITSPTGAVIKDILHRLADRFPRHVLIWPVRVQGDGAAEEIANAIKGFNELGGETDVPRPDLLIVARGGGSLEDLWAFNEEIVVRAAAGSAIPLISAVGHETDTTLIDFASDLRAPTPTAAAELAVPVHAELVATVSDLDRRRKGAVTRFLNEQRQRLDGLSRGLPRLVDLLGFQQQKFDELADRLPRGLMSNTQLHRQTLADRGAGLRLGILHNLVAQGQQRLNVAQSRLSPAMDRRLDGSRQKFGAASRLLESLSYHGVLSRGYVVVRDPEGRPVISAQTPNTGDRLKLEFGDGHTDVMVTGRGKQNPGPSTKKDNARAKAKRTKKPGTEGNGGKQQGSLFS